MARPSRLRAWSGMLALLLVVFVSRTGWADVATAEALFQEGRRLLEQGRTEEACPKLAESQRLDPSSGTLINLAACHAKLGMTATAWAEFLAAARLALAQQRPLRAEEAKRRAAELEPKVPYLTVRVAARPPGLVLTHNGTRLAESALGMALPVDPGDHVVVATAPGHEEWTTTVTISEPGQHRVVDVPELAPEKPKPVEEKVEPEPAKAAPPPLPPRAPPRPAPRARALPLSFWVAGGTSLGAAVVTGVFGGLSLASYDKAESLCEGRHVDCSDEAVQAGERAWDQGNVANVALGTALVAAVVAGWIYFTSDDSESSGTRVGKRHPVR